MPSAKGGLMGKRRSEARYTFSVSKDKKLAKKMQEKSQKKTSCVQLNNEKQRQDADRYRKDDNSTSNKTPDLRQSITKRTAAAMTTTVPWRAAHSPLPHIPLRSRVQLLAFVNYGSQAVTPKMEEASDVDNAGKKFTTTTTANQ